MPATHTLPRVGDWLGRSFRALGRRWLTLTLLGLCGTLVVLLGTALVYGVAGACVYFFTDKEALARLASPGALEAVTADPTFQALVLVVHGVALLVALRLGSWFALAAMHAACYPNVGAGRALRVARKRSMAFLGLFLVSQILIQAGMLMLLVPGLVLAVYLGFAPFVFVRQGMGVWGSLRGSWRAASGHFFGIFGRSLLLGLVCMAVAIVPVLGWIAAPCLALLAWAELHNDLSGRRPAFLRARPVPASPRPTKVPRPAASGETERPAARAPEPPAQDHVH